MLLVQVKRFFALATLISAIFCYFKVYSQGYTQPLAQFFGFIATTLVWKEFKEIARPRDRLVLVSFALFGILLFSFCLNNFFLQELKYLSSYISPFLVVPPIIWMLHKDRLVFSWALRFGALIWIFVAFIQVVFIRDFGTSYILDSQVVSDIAYSGRGVTGLAPEPTHYGLFMLLMSVALIKASRNKIDDWLTFFAFMAAIIFANSGTVILVIFLSFGVYCFREKPINFFWSLLLIALLGLMLRATMNPDLINHLPRVLSLILQAEIDPQIVFYDLSINSRLGGIFASIPTCFKSLFHPYGLSHDAWIIAKEQIMSSNRWLLSISDAGVPSGYGVLIFQGGLVSLFFVFWFISKFSNYGNISGKLKPIVLGTLPLVFLFQFYISVPFFSVILAQILYSQRPE